AVLRGVELARHQRSSPSTTGIAAAQGGSTVGQSAAPSSGLSCHCAFFFRVGFRETPQHPLMMGRWRTGGRPIFSQGTCTAVSDRPLPKHLALLPTALAGDGTTTFTLPPATTCFALLLRFSATEDYNYEVCGFDGGDCCEETCVDAENKCGIDGYDCWDPDQERETQEPQYSSTLYADDDDSGSSEGCNVIWINDGECDHRNNWEKCNYDGGDCCRESCVDSKYTCGDYFLCRDPDIATPAPTATFFNRTCLSESIGDSVCDPENNYELCLYDGGDCCAPSCEGDNCGRVGYNCTDPETPDYGPDCNMEYVGDGECDPV
ncbi:unnamed protein product, partial [Scytosiphon promiscuus]